MNSRTRILFIPHFVGKTDDEFCNECNTNRLIECCNKCGEGVCVNDNCSTIFPHYKNTVFVLCRSCSDQIESKLKVVIDLDKLRLLKNKICNKRTKKQAINKK